MSNKIAYYQQENLWDTKITSYQKNVFFDIVTNIPEGVKTILDTGCGNGLITEKIPSQYQVTGLDWSYQAIKKLKCKKVVASLSALPFEDNSYDLVMANDVIEHIYEEEYETVLKELIRVAKDYVIITVPFMETLDAYKTECCECGHIFHINHHQRSFDVKKLLSLQNENFHPQKPFNIKKLFSSQNQNFQCEKIIYSGDQLPYSQIIHDDICEMLGVLKTWPHACCPLCSSKLTKGNVLEGKILDILSHVYFNKKVANIQDRPDRNECIAIFSKNKKPKNNNLIKNLTVFSLKNTPSKKPIYVAQKWYQGIEFLLPRVSAKKDNWTKVPKWFIYNQEINSESYNMRKKNYLFHIIDKFFKESK